MHIFSCCLVLVTRETLGSIGVVWKKNCMLMKVSTRRERRKQEAEGKQEYEEEKGSVRRL